ncbi:putative PAS/PAC sensor protein (plasmid) [Herpetosiphon aurantiacus DSM 785]|uniref:PAS/PAC sensor protein n=1 Tax=Herpetosiphon aurantiacus (strain ATCC 23779 / DSM 785 / 114-95) TaxID=316274 RepID=A9B911_HERA2|nr:putative PAS/PAC sensor protein [Herpetosiphon aurantiacus DSM 785]
MEVAPIPSDESARIQALHGLGILDTPPDPRFDRLTRLAQRLFHVPIVLISLVDTNRQWFKSCIGLDVQQSSREISFCAHAILQPDRPLIILDTWCDTRFADNPVVSGTPHIRFYAGHVLHAPSGAAVGTLCLLDTVVHSVFSDDDQEILADLAMLVERELAANTMHELLQTQHRLMTDFQESELRFRQMAETIDAVFWMSDSTRQQLLYISPAYERIWGYSCASLYADLQSWVTTIHPDDRASVTASMSKQAHTLRALEYRIIRSDGAERWIYDQSYPIYNDSDQVIRLVGLARDITQRKQQDLRVVQLTEQLTSLMQSLPGVVYRCSPDINWGVTILSDGIETLTGYPASDFLHNTIRPFVSCIDPLDRVRVEETMTAAIIAQQPYSVDYRIIHRDGEVCWVTNRGRAVYDDAGRVRWCDGVIIDVNARAAIEADHRRFVQLADMLPEFVGMATLDGQPIYINPAGRALIGMRPEEPLARQPLTALHPSWVQELLQTTALPTALAEGYWSGETALVTADGNEIPIDQMILCHRDAADQPTHFSTIARDLTHERQAAATRQALQAEILQIHTRTIMELSTPLIHITDTTILMPLIGAIDTIRAQRILESLLQGVSQQRASRAIVDLTGVPALDPHVAAIFIQAADAVRLLGAEVIVTGIRPEIAQTIVTMGVDLRRIRTYSDLHQGISYAMQGL